MSYNGRLKIIAIITYLFLLLLATYFKYFPIIINATITNVFTFLLVFMLASLLVYGGIVIKNSKDVYLILPQSLIFVFIARAIPNLRLSYPPLHDPYFHFITALNIINFGTLKPILEWWYNGVDMQLHWPMMHLLTTALVRVTNVDVMQVFRYQEPLMGVIYFLVVFMLAKTVINNNGFAIISALFASFSDVIIFYQSEYHPQGLAIIFFMLLLYSFIRSRNVNNISFRYVSLIFIVAFVLSHYFTPFFLALIFSAYLVVLIIIRFLSFHMYIKNKFYNIIEHIKLDHNLLLIIFTASLMYHFLIYTNFVNGILGVAQREHVLNADFISIAQPGIPLLTSVLSASKWGLFILAAISILWILKTKNANEFRLAIFFITIIMTGIIGNYIIASPLDRIIAFYIPFAAIFASLSLFRFKDEWFRCIHKNKKTIFIILIASTIMTAGFFNSQMPAYFFQDSKVNTYYWYSNMLPSMREYKVAGEWFGVNTPLYSTVITEFDTVMIPFYYGKRNYIFVKRWDIERSDKYIMVNPNIPYNNKISQKTPHYNHLNTIYNNGELELYYQTVAR